MLNIQKNTKLSNYSTFKIGGETKEFVVVKNEKELLEAIDYAKSNKFKFFVLGGGSNVLFDDKGFDGLIIKISGKNEEIKTTNGDEKPKPGEPYGKPKIFKINCWAGESLSFLVNFAKDNSLSGLEWAVGIPGTVGGAISGNAGAFGGTISDAIENVKVLRMVNFEFPVSDRFANYKKEKCDFGYRRSMFQENKDAIIVSARFVLQKKKKEEIEEKMNEFIKQRALKQPKGWIGSSGSFFKNPIVENNDLREKFEKETGAKTVDERIPAGWLIEKAGLKGKKFKNVIISDVNANFLINDGGATTEEIIAASGIIKQRVRDEFGIELKEEVVRVPF